MAILVDTGPLFTLANEADRYHHRVRQYMAGGRETWIIPEPVVTEACIGILDRLGAHAELAFLRSLAAKELLVEPLTDADLPRHHDPNVSVKYLVTA